ncbi:ribonuclease III [Nitrosovibrio sp. Nv17]|uniref:ribonuclease III n=1 Tax=Nitrosovibrio sp. Nv17 TaxID=1855339 RepID=UPI000908ED6E|nr:ribonuclease III [Nitrosovibrio sp. Nv17]SFW13331.1 RNAse III [Nitrosovibrio sp. Nv17]
MANLPLSRKIGYTFNQPGLLHQALTHRSHGLPHNERLEFLGDSVLNCAVAILLFRQFPELTEGNLSRLRANLVNRQALAGLAQDLELGGLIRLGEGEIRNGGNQRPSILADTLEAVLGAVYLDGGFAETEKIVARLFTPLLHGPGFHTLDKDPKTLLQEILQGRRLALPHYAVIATTGGAHEQQFEVECIIQKPSIRTLGTGRSRRSAEQEAARRAYEQLRLSG